MSSAIDIIQGALKSSHTPQLNNNTIYLHKGDTFVGNLYLNQGTLLTPVRYELTANDIVYLSVTEVNYSFDKGIIKKVYTPSSAKSTEGDLIITISKDDTAFLVPGLYYYSVKVVTSTIPAGSQNSVINEEVKTVIPLTPFYVLQ